MGMGAVGSGKSLGCSTRLSIVEGPTRQVSLAALSAIHCVGRVAGRLHTTTNLAQRVRPPLRALLELLDLDWICVLASTIDVGELVCRVGCELPVDRQFDLLLTCTRLRLRPELPSL
jgi:hypothetical protein